MKQFVYFPQPSSLSLGWHQATPSTTLSFRALISGPSKTSTEYLVTRYPSGLITSKQMVMKMSLPTSPLSLGLRSLLYHKRNDKMRKLEFLHYKKTFAMPNHPSANFGLPRLWLLSRFKASFWFSTGPMGILVTRLPSMAH
jgi:hypothetical protein